MQGSFNKPSRSSLTAVSVIFCCAAQHPRNFAKSASSRLPCSDSSSQESISTSKISFSESDLNSIGDSSLESSSKLEPISSWLLNLFATKASTSSDFSEADDAQALAFIFLKCLCRCCLILRRFAHELVPFSKLIPSVSSVQQRGPYLFLECQGLNTCSTHQFRE